MACSKLFIDNPVKGNEDILLRDDAILHDEADYFFLEKKKGFKLSSINAFGLRKRHIHIDYMLKGSDVILVQESGLKNQHLNNIFEKDSFTLFRLDSTSKKRGLVSYIKNKLIPYTTELKDLNIINEYIELQVFKINEPKIKNRTIINFYRPHTFLNNEVFYSILNNTINDKRIANSEIWIAGDANIDAANLLT